MPELPKINPTTTKSWQDLSIHYEFIKSVHLNQLFTDNVDRFERFSMRHEGLLFDFSKHRINDQTLLLFDRLGEECGVHNGIHAMFGGKPINETEGRAVLHVALRANKDQSFLVEGVDVMPSVREVLSRMKDFCDEVIQGRHKGYTGKPIKHVVNIGIGGSDLGPYMAVEALKHYGSHLSVHFVSNVDASHLLETLKHCDPETTLFIVVSKTFTTEETMTNAATAKRWLIAHLGFEDAVLRHFAAVSTNLEAVGAFGIDQRYVFGFWDWVGGRYSVWGAVGLSLMLAIGPVNFESFLAGANAVDNHVLENGVSSIPGRMAQLAIWYNNFFEAETQAILPYEQYLHRFPAFLQQADMESNGKSVDRNGNRIDYQSGPIIWGEPGTNGQHAFYQLIHQGTKLVPCDFIAFARCQHSEHDHHEKLLANCLAQSLALMQGKSSDRVMAEVEARHYLSDATRKQLAYRTFEGNIPSTTLIFEELNPFALGQLIALYEHKIFIVGLYLNLYSFDQWGVELGKQLAKPILQHLKEGSVPTHLDHSTRGLMKSIFSFGKK